MQCWTIVKKNVVLSLKSQSVSCWESQIHCISPLRYYLADVFKALKELKNYCLEKKDGEAVNSICALIVRTKSWILILSIVIHHGLFFQIKKTGKVMQTSGAL